jgi:predicted phage tail protein
MAKAKPRNPKGFLVRGSGKPKAPKKPPEHSQNEYTQSIVRILGVVSEGPIEGLQGWTDGVQLDETPLSSNGVMNFANVGLDFRAGNPWQSHMSTFADEINNQQNVGTEVKGNLPPVTKVIVNNNIDSIGLSLSFTLQEYPSSGGVVGSSVAFEIWIKEGNGAYALKLSRTVSGRYASPIVLDFKFEVQRGLNRYEVRVKRLTPDNPNTTQYQQVLTWVSYSENSAVRLRYPYSALVGVQLDAQQFDSTPEFGFLAGGRLVQIPSNAAITPTRGLQFSGPWNGTLVEPHQAVSDPAWILYDLLTNEIYGLGKQLGYGTIDRWSFYELSKWCNTLVPSATGGMEPRYSCNFLISDKEDAWRVLDSIRSIFAGFLYYINGTVYVAWDSPKPATMQFTTADVVDGIFSYSRPPYSDRYSVALVTWIDPSDNYKQAVESVEDLALIDKLGVIVKEISAFGCTSRGQAIRAGKMSLRSPGTVTFTARSYAGRARPGSVIKIFDNRRQSLESSGLVAASAPLPGGQLRITLDRPVTIDPGQSYTLTCGTHTLSASGDPSASTIEDRMVLTGPGSYLELTVPAYGGVIISGTNWVLSSGPITPELYTVINVVSLSENNYTTYEVFAIEHDPNLWSEIELGLVAPLIEPRSRIPTVPPPPTNVGVTSRVIASQSGGNTNTLYISWDAPKNSDGTRNPYISGYYVEYRRGLDGVWGETRTVNTPNLEIDGVQSGAYYQARVASITLAGQPSLWVESKSYYAGSNFTADFGSRNNSAMLTLL